MAKWIFFDPVLNATYTFSISPDSATMGGGKRNLNIAQTTAPNGRVVKFEGRRQPDTIQFSGQILDQAQYDALNTWVQKKYQIRLTDDLNRQFWIYLTQFNPSRQLNRNVPWRHSYTAEAIVLDWT